MIIEDSLYEGIVSTLNLGGFPKNVLEYQDSQDFFQQLVFIDYQLQLLIQNEFDGAELVPAILYQSSDEPQSLSDKLTSLISYAESIFSNYNETHKDYTEKLYSTVIMSHLHFLNSRTDLMQDLLRSIEVDSSHIKSAKLTTSQNSFLNYLVCRYNVLIGITDIDNSYKLWIEYLCNKGKPFTKSEVAGNYWLEILFKYLSLQITDNGTRQLSFTKDILSLKFKSNKVSLIRYCNFLVNFKLEININRIIDKDFRQDYSKYLSDELKTILKTEEKGFPHASNENNDVDEFVDNLYSTLGSKKHKFIDSQISKKFLISATEKTFQSEIVLATLIKVLIELSEYDEALAAFKTYISYIEKDQLQQGGQVQDILSVIEIYSLCLINFNPLNAVKLEKFKHNDTKSVVEQLHQFSQDLTKYLNILKVHCNLSYDEDIENLKVKNNYLSFLYYKYNPNILLSDRSDLISLISSAWYSLGYLYNYLLVFETPNIEYLKTYQQSLLTSYKNSLIVNSTGNLSHLFSLALSLSYINEIASSVKLCKFILKKYPESFQTWNLLALLKSSEESDNDQSGNKKESEKFINNALNIAGIFIVKCKNDNFRIPLRTKFEILQLKLTQLSIWESLHGPRYILDYLSEVFILFYELFDIKYEEQVKTQASGYLIDSKWSHRPSFIDPKVKLSPEGGVDKRTLIAKDNIKKLSKLHRQNSRVSSTGSVKRAAKLTSSERRLLQDIWLWASKAYIKAGLKEESEQCIIEAETVFEPNIKTFTQLGYLTSRYQKFLSLQEFEKSLENLDELESVNKIDYLETLLGLSKLFLIDDSPSNSLFISAKDQNSGLIRLKNRLEKFLFSWPVGYNSVEVWYYLSILYEKFDDKILLAKSLNRCIELETIRPTRHFYVCDENLNFEFE